MYFTKKDLQSFISYLTKLDGANPQEDSVEVDVNPFTQSEGHWLRSSLLIPIGYNETKRESGTLAKISKVDLRSYTLYLDGLEAIPFGKCYDFIRLSEWQGKYTEQQRKEYAELYINRQDFRAKYHAIQEQVLAEIERERREKDKWEAQNLERLRVEEPEKYAEIVWERFRREDPPIEPCILPTPVMPTPPLSGTLREWWLSILGNYGRFSCCAIILALPSDTETIRYLDDFGKELDLITGKNCLVIALTQIGFMRSGFDDRIRSIAINEHISEGHSLQVAKLLNIKFTEFPCLVLFDDIRSTDYVVASLKGMEAKEIAEKMRSVFSVVQGAISKKEKPIAALKRQQNAENMNRGTQAFFNNVTSFAGKTFQKAIETWISATIK